MRNPQNHIGEYVSFNRGSIIGIGRLMQVYDTPRENGFCLIQAVDFRSGMLRYTRFPQTMIIEARFVSPNRIKHSDIGKIGFTYGEDYSRQFFYISSIKKNHIEVVGMKIAEDKKEYLSEDPSKEVSKLNKDQIFTKLIS